jgi:hypothetical protein
MPLIGEKIRLNLQLWDGATNRFVRAYLYDADGTQIASVNLAHLARGLYEDDSIQMPSTAQVRAVYRVYTNPSYTQVSEKHSDSIDVFVLDSAGPSNCEELIGVIETGEELIGTVSEAEEIIGEIDECDLINGSPPC